jgi:hypothetical protein
MVAIMVHTFRLRGAEFVRFCPWGNFDIDHRLDVQFLVSCLALMASWVNLGIYDMVEGGLKFLPT